MSAALHDVLLSFGQGLLYFVYFAGLTHVAWTSEFKPLDRHGNAIARNSVQCYFYDVVAACFITVWPLLLVVLIVLRLLKGHKNG